jgi:hypothetical protein
VLVGREGEGGREREGEKGREGGGGESEIERARKERRGGVSGRFAVRIAGSGSVQ